MRPHTELRHLAESGQSIPAADVLMLLDEMDAMQPVINRHASELAMERLEADRRRIRAEARAEQEAYNT